jgi:PIN domain nuclease of toxin-antitoxin system
MGCAEVIILDTHIWIWWCHGDSRLPPHYESFLREHEQEGVGVRAISVWEFAMLV